MEFKTIELSDRKIFSDYYKKYKQRSSYLSFVSLFTWQKPVNFRYGMIDGNIVIKFDNMKTKKECYLIPETNKEILKTVVDKLSEAGEIKLYNLTLEQTEQLKELYPGRFEFTHKRDNDNYCYLTEKLITLSGKKLHSKRNFVNRFRKENQYIYEKLDNTNYGECIKVLDEWCAKKGCEEGALREETCACRLALKNMDALGLKGGAVKVDGKIIAFSLGEYLSDETAVIHFEKADTDFNGAFQIINNEFVKNEWQDTKYINREEDMGVEGLRKAKMSYYPEFMLEMYVADENNQS